jgi:methyl-accepting chemotaxis protein
MNWFKNQKMAMKLTLGFGISFVLTLLVGVMALRSLSTVKDLNTVMYEQHALGIAHIKEANVLLVKGSRALRNALLDDAVADKQKRWSDARQFRKDFGTAMAAFDKTIVSDEVRRQAAEAKDKYQEVSDGQDVAFELTIGGKTDEAKEMLKTLRAGADEIDAMMDAIEKDKMQRLLQAAADIESTYSSTRNTLVGIIAVCMALTILLVWTIARLITRPLSEAVGVLQHVARADFSETIKLDTHDEIGDLARATNLAITQIKDALGNVRTAAEAMAQGDFSVDVRKDLPGELGVMANALGTGITSLRGAVANVREASQELANGNLTIAVRSDLPGELGVMAAALNEAVTKLRGAMTDVRETANAVASSSDQLAAASQEISSGAQEQASSLEETAASLEEMTATIKQNADNAQQASQLAGGARTTAEDGGQVVSEAVQAMSAINESSKKIADIITTIDEIAFQTNLLALNAAVEAARAGEQGRGFAVVAAEVRNLAQRSATAAKEIKDLISDSTRKVEAGSALVNASGKTLNEIVAAVKRVTDIVAEIAAASREQSSGIEQVNKAVTQMDQVTQANASQTEEMSGTSESLSGEAGKLQGLVRRFKLGEDAHAEAQPRPAARKPVSMMHRKPAAGQARRPQTPQTAGTAALALDNEFQEF